MKKVLLTTMISAALGASAFAQGTIALSASASHGLVTYSTDGTTKTSVPAGASAQVGTYGTLNIAAYSAAPGTASPEPADVSGALPLNLTVWNESSNVWHQIAPAAGNTPAITFTLGANSGAGGGSMQIMIFGWTGTYLDFNAALAAAQAGQALVGYSGSLLSSGLLGWTQGTGAPNGSPPGPAISVPYGATAGFNGLSLQQVPEPATFALAGLGAAAMLIFRRRK